jgi:putative endonuclease
VTASPVTSEPSPPYRHRAALGRAGEEAAARYLGARGFRILERRYRTRAGEIDLIAEEGRDLVFIEVKARSSFSCGRPAEAVDHRKRSRLVRAAQVYLQRRGGPDRPCRFDVVEVVEPAGGDRRISLIRAAFEAD